jgi:hypothetical protein
MGLFDKAKQFLAGTHAKVSVQLPAIAFPGQPIAVKVTATAAANFDCDGVYLLVGGTESVKIDQSEGPDIHKSESTFSQKFQVAPGFKMAKDETKEWTTTITLPPTLPPTFQGKLTKHVVQVQAGLDTKGNDPDSGWVDLRFGMVQ